MIPCRIGFYLRPEVDLVVEGRELEFVVDTGFNGPVGLAIREDILDDLNAEPLGSLEFRYMGGEPHSLPTYGVTVDWDGSQEDSEAVVIRYDQESDYLPPNLLGTWMMENCRLELFFQEGSPEGRIITNRK